METQNNFISEDNLLIMLSCSKSTVRDYLKKGLFSRYEYGNKYFYKISEVNDFIESTKKKERNIIALEKFSDFQKDKSKEKMFLFDKASYLLKLMNDLDFNFINERHLEITKLLFEKNGDFEYVANKYDVTRERIRHIIDKTLRRIYNRCIFMKMNYDNFERVIAENEKLTTENIAIRKLIESNTKIEECNYGALSIGIQDLNLTVRAFNCLNAAKIKSLGELLGYSSNDLLRFRNFGVKSLREIEQSLNEKGLKLKVN